MLWYQTSTNRLCCNFWIPTEYSNIVTSKTVCQDCSSFFYSEEQNPACSEYPINKTIGILTSSRISCDPVLRITWLSGELRGWLDQTPAGIKPWGSPRQVAGSLVHMRSWIGREQVCGYSGSYGRLCGLLLRGEFLNSSFTFHADKNTVRGFKFYISSIVT